MSESQAEMVARIARDYFWGWQEKNWERLRELLSPQIEFESPALGIVRGIEAHIELYTSNRRFPTIESIALRRTVHDEDLAFLSYEVYLTYHKRATVIDQLSVDNGRVIHVLAVMSEWPETD